MGLEYFWSLVLTVQLSALWLTMWKTEYRIHSLFPPKPDKVLEGANDRQWGTGDEECDGQNWTWPKWRRVVFGYRWSRCATLFARFDLHSNCLLLHWRTACPVQCQVQPVPSQCPLLVCLRHGRFQGGDARHSLPQCQRISFQTAIKRDFINVKNYNLKMR